MGSAPPTPQPPHRNPLLHIYRIPPGRMRMYTSTHVHHKPVCVCVCVFCQPNDRHVCSYTAGGLSRRPPLPDTHVRTPYRAACAERAAATVVDRSMMAAPEIPLMLCTNVHNCFFFSVFLVFVWPARGRSQLPIRWLLWRSAVHLDVCSAQLPCKGPPLPVHRSHPRLLELVSSVGPVPSRRMYLLTRSGTSPVGLHS